jgi:vancomycin permeability regulator SanA
MFKRKKLVITVLAVLVALGLLSTAAVFGINAYVKHVGGGYIISEEEACEMKDVDCIIVLGCQVRSDKSPSDMLKDRLDHALVLYDGGASPKILMSGDHGRVEYDEVNAMKQYAVDRNVPSGDVFMDHAGFSTYETVYRAKEIFGCDKVLIVTQEYHLYRALYIAERLGLEAYGVAADGYDYPGQTLREMREILARNKDFLTGIIKPKPTYLGEVISIDGNGDVTND